MAGLGLLRGWGFGPSPGNHRCLCSSPATRLFPRVCWARFPWVQQLRHVHLWVLAKRPSCLCRDISPLLKDPVAFRALIDLLEDHLRTSLPPIDFIAGGCSPGQSTVLPGWWVWGDTSPRGQEISEPLGVIRITACSVGNTSRGSTLAPVPWFPEILVWDVADVI